MDDKTTYQDTDTQTTEQTPAAGAPLESDTEIQETEPEEVMPEEEQAPPFCDKVFGMPRLCVYGVFIGYGAGLVAAGLFTLISGIDVGVTSIPGFIGAIVGYLLCNRQVKRILAQAEAEKKAALEKQS